MNLRTFCVASWETTHHEGLDEDLGLYFVFLALQAFPTDYISLKVIDYKKGHRWTKDYLGTFRAAPGSEMDVT